jgi:hypothetical protein
MAENKEWFGSDFFYEGAARCVMRECAIGWLCDAPLARYVMRDCTIIFHK